MVTLACTVLLFIAFITPSKTPCTSGVRFACANCSAVSVCSYGGVQVDTYRCNSVDANRPFCSGNTGICKSDPEGDCIQPSDLCPRASDTFPRMCKIPKYPKLLQLPFQNCMQYIQCDSLKQPRTVSCTAPSYVYDHPTRSCKRLQTSNDCFQVNCALASNRWASYRPAPALAFFCSSAVGPMTFECTGENQVFSVASRSCVFGCPREGHFPVPTDATKYYQFTRGVYNVLVSREVSCAAGLVFDPSLASCTLPSSTTTELSVTAEVSSSLTTDVITTIDTTTTSTASTEIFETNPTSSSADSTPPAV